MFGSHGRDGPHEVSPAPLYDHADSEELNRRTGLREIQTELPKSAMCLPGKGELLYTLHVDAPFLFIESKCLKSPMLAESLCFIYVLIASIISCAGVSFRVFVCRRVRVARRRWRWGVLCITLPNASSTACDVKFSEGIRLMKCFCLRFSCRSEY